MDARAGGGLTAAAWSQQCEPGREGASQTNRNDAVEKKTGTAGTIVAPAAPTEALEADTASPGQVEAAKAAQKSSKAGKYGSVPSQPFVPPPVPTEWQGKELSWIELELIGMDDKPVTGELYEITVPDGRVYRGSTDQNGKGRVEGFEPGSCKITFPNLDQDAWEDA